MLYSRVCLFVRCIFPPSRHAFCQRKLYGGGGEEKKECYLKKRVAENFFFPGFPSELPCCQKAESSHEHIIFSHSGSVGFRRLVVLTKPKVQQSRRDAVRAEKYLNHRRRWLYCLPRGHSLREEVPALQGSLSEFIVVDRWICRARPLLYFFFSDFLWTARLLRLFVCVR